MNEHRTRPNAILLVFTSWFLRKKINFVRKKIPLPVSDIFETHSRDHNILEFFYILPNLRRVKRIVFMRNTFGIYEFPH